MTNPDDLTAENARLRQQLAEVTEERDILHRAVLKQLARNVPPLTEEDMASAIPSGPWLEEFVKRIQAGDPNAMDVVPTPDKG
jgi:hypothetical protein